MKTTSNALPSKNWEYEEFYYGNANWPSDTLWRHNNGKYYQEVHVGYVNSLEDAQILWTYYDDQGWVDPYYSENVGSGTIKSLHAWVSSNEEQYLRAKKPAMPLIDGSYTYPHDKWLWVPIKNNPNSAQ